MTRTPIQYVYDSFDVLIDICVDNGLPVRAQKLRDMRDGTEDFPITSVSREDIKHASFPDVEFTDAEMKKIAQKLCNDYIEQMYWKSLEIFVQEVLDEREC